MKFSFEVPIKYLEEIDECQDYVYALAHMLDNKKYFEYVTKTEKMVILDNSAHELGESIDVKKYIKLCEKINPDIIILPDKLFDRKRTDELSNEFIRLYTGKAKLMKVVQGSNIKEYISHFLKIQYDNKIDIVGISMSRRLIAPSLSFVLKYNELTMPIHLLGCCSPIELIEASGSTNISTIDTGLPINFAIQNKEFPKIDSSRDWKRISGKDLDYEGEIDIELMKKNIKIFKEYNYEISGY